MQPGQCGVAVEGELLHERLAGLRIVPVARRLARLLVVVVALEAAADLGGELVADDGEQAYKRRANQRDRVLRRDGVVERGRIQHALAPDEPCPARRIEHYLEDPIRLVGPTEPLAHLHQDRVREAGVIEIERARRILPACIEREGVHRLAVAHARVALEHHHDRDDPRRDRRPPRLRVEVSKRIVREQLVRLGREQSEDRPLRQAGFAKLPGRPVEVLVARSAPQRHASSDIVSTQNISIF